MQFRFFIVYQVENQQTDNNNDNNINTPGNQ